MFKAGDKVVCMDNNIFSSTLKVGEVYTVYRLSRLYFVLLTINNVEYDVNRFISIGEYRRLKLEKIRSKI